MTTKRPMTEGKTRPRRDVPLDRLATKPAEKFAPTLAELEADRAVFRELRYLMLRSERLWLLDCSGDYWTYRTRLRALAKDYGISVPEERG